MRYFLLLKGTISLQACFHIIQIVKICWYSFLLFNKCMQCSIESLASCSSSKQRPLPRFRIRPFFHYLELPVVTYCAVNWTFSSNKLSFNYQITAPSPSEAVFLSIYFNYTYTIPGLCKAQAWLYVQEETFPSVIVLHIRHCNLKTKAEA